MSFNFIKMAKIFLWLILIIAFHIVIIFMEIVLWICIIICREKCSLKTLLWKNIIEINYLKRKNIISGGISVSPGTCVCGQFRNFKNIQNAKHLQYMMEVREKRTVYELKFKLILIFFFCVPLPLPHVSTWYSQFAKSVGWAVSRTKSIRTRNYMQLSDTWAYL